MEANSSFHTSVRDNIISKDNYHDYGNRFEIEQFLTPNLTYIPIYHIKSNKSKFFVLEFNFVIYDGTILFSYSSDIFSPVLFF